MIRNLERIMKKKSSLLLMAVILFAGISAAYLATTSLNLVTSNPYGWQLFVGPDPASVPVDGQGTIQMFVYASEPYPNVLFTLYVDGQQVAQAYGSGHNNVVEYDVTLSGSNYAVGTHQITASAKVAQNPPFTASATLYIYDPNGEPISQFTPYPTATPTPTPQTTAQLTNTPVPTVTPQPQMQQPFYQPFVNFWNWLTHIL